MQPPDVASIAYTSWPEPASTFSHSGCLLSGTSAAEWRTNVVRSPTPRAIAARMDDRAERRARGRHEANHADSLKDRRILAAEGAGNARDKDRVSSKHSFFCLVVSLRSFCGKYLLFTR